MLREGWDYWSPEGPARSEPLGIFRAPHLALLGEVPASAIPGCPILAHGMNASEIEAAFYRQCRIMPDAPYDGVSVDGDPYHIIPDEDYDPARAWIFRAVTGHTPWDLAVFISDYAAHDPESARLLIAKDFKTALRLKPELLRSVGWPDSVRRSWGETGGADNLPPFLALVLHAELARHAMNDRGMIALSYDDEGRQLTMRGFLNGIEPTAIEGGSGNLSRIVNPHRGMSSADRLLEMIPFQTIALLPPTVVF